MEDTPKPTIPTPTGTEARVCEDIAQRQAKGIAKYGKTVADNPLALREWLQHAYEETLDKAIYLRRSLEEMEKTACAKPPPSYDFKLSEAEKLLGWIPWSGGKCPVPPEMVVHVVFRSGARHLHFPAECWVWEHGNSGVDIVAYRVAEKEASKQ